MCKLPKFGRIPREKTHHVLALFLNLFLNSSPKHLAVDTVRDSIAS